MSPIEQGHVVAVIDFILRSYFVTSAAEQTAAITRGGMGGAFFSFCCLPDSAVANVMASLGVSYYDDVMRTDSPTD